MTKFGISTPSWSHRISEIMIYKSCFFITCKRLESTGWRNPESALRARAAESLRSWSISLVFLVSYKLMLSMLSLLSSLVAALYTPWGLEASADFQHYQNFENCEQSKFSLFTLGTHRWCYWQWGLICGRRRMPPLQSDKTPMCAFLFNLLYDKCEYLFVQIHLFHMQDLYQ